MSAQNHLLGVKTLGAGNAWAVGSHNVPGSWAFSTLTMRWNGQAWSVVPSPDTASFENHLLAIDGVSPDDLWAVGHTRNGDYSVSAPLILHWDGSAWSVVPSPTANDGTLEGVVALASDDVWAVGSMFSTALLWHVPFALHWDGRSWSSVAVPSPTPQGGRLFGVAALSPAKVYAVGQAPASRRWCCAGTAPAGPGRPPRPRERSGTPPRPARAPCGRSGSAATPTSASGGPSPCGPATADDRAPGHPGPWRRRPNQGRVSRVTPGMTTKVMRLSRTRGNSADLTSRGRSATRGARAHWNSTTSG